MMRISSRDAQDGKADGRMKWVWMFRWSGRALLSLLFIGIFIVSQFLLFSSLDQMLLVTAAVFSVMLLALVVTRIWAQLYWINYDFEILEDKIVINSGVITKRKVSIPYERIQNINVVKGVFERMFGVFNIDIETAGNSASSGYSLWGRRGRRAEGVLEGIILPKPIEDYIWQQIKRTRGGSKDKLDKESSSEMLEQLREMRRSVSDEDTDEDSHSGASSRTVTLNCPFCEADFKIKRKPGRKMVNCPYCGMKIVL
jgi:uncharacterized membrane protein YdbT with pleckstrin-like domain